MRREELGMSQEELAKKLGYKSRSSINKIELGGQNLTQTKIKQIADALFTTPYYIMGWDSQGQTDNDMEVIGRLIKQDPHKARTCLEALMPLDDESFQAVMTIVRLRSK